jgi:hypothetical protein
MNERIRELAEQCVGDRPYNNSFDYEKFAELIIQECIGKKEWVGLTDEELAEIDGVVMKYIGTGEYVIDGEYEFARAIETKLREKNT